MLGRMDHMTNDIENGPPMIIEGLCEDPDCPWFQWYPRHYHFAEA